MTEICTFANNILQIRNLLIGLGVLFGMIMGLHLPYINSIISSISKFAKQILIIIGGLVTLSLVIKLFCVI